MKERQTQVEQLEPAMAQLTRLQFERERLEQQVKTAEGKVAAERKRQRERQRMEEERHGQAEAQLRQVLQECEGVRKDVCKLSLYRE
jgi:hypothetical protein